VFLLRSFEQAKIAANVGSWHKADKPTAPEFVCF